MIRKEIKEWFESQNMVMDEIDVFWLGDLVNFLEKREIAVLDQQPTILVDVPNGPPIDFVKNFKWKVYDNGDWETTSRSYLDFSLAFSYAQSLLENSKGGIVVCFVDESIFFTSKGASSIPKIIYRKMLSLVNTLIENEENEKRMGAFAEFKQRQAKNIDR